MSARTIFIILCITFAVYFFVRTEGKEGMIGSMTKSRCPNLLVQKGSKIYLYNTALSEVPGVNPIMFDNLEEYTEFIDWQRSQGIRCPVLYLQETYDASGKLVCKARPCVVEPQGGLPPTNSTLDANATVFRDSLDDGTGNASYDSGVSGTDVSNVSGTAGSNISGTSGSNISGTSGMNGYGGKSTSRYGNLERMKLIDAGIDDPPFNRGHYPSYDPSPFYHGVHTPLDQLDVIEESKPVSANAMDPNWGGKEHTQTLIDSDYYVDNEVHLY